MKIGEIARRLGVTPRTLRFYEEQGFIRPRRSARGTRHYDEADAQRFAAILNLARLGVPLDTLKPLTTARANSAQGDEAGRKVFAELTQLRAELTKKQAELARVEADLALAEERVRGCFDCARPPTEAGCQDCPTATGLRETRVFALIWEQSLHHGEKNEE